MNNDIKKEIIHLLNAYIDSVLLPEGFKRRKNSLLYSRVGKKVEQKIIFHIESSPSYTNAEAVIIIYFRLFMPEAVNFAKEILSDSVSHFFDDGLVINNQIHNLIGSKKMYPMYEISHNNYENLGQSIKNNLSAYAIPCINNLINLEDFIKLFECYQKYSSKSLSQAEWPKNIPWQPFNHQMMILIIAILIMKNQRDEARLILAQQFQGDAPKRIYKEAFKYLNMA